MPFVARLGFFLPVLGNSISKTKSILSQKPKQANAFCCSLWLFLARFGFLWMFPFEHRIARCGFLLVRKTKTSNKRQKKSKWKPGFKLIKGNLHYLSYFFWKVLLKFCPVRHKTHSIASPKCANSKLSEYITFWVSEFKAERKSVLCKF